MRSRLHWLAVCLAVVLAPILANTFVPASNTSGRFAGWVNEWDGEALKRIDFTWREAAFRDGFPGQAGRFTDGRRELIMRYTERATRRMLPAEECFRRAGFRITTLDGYTDAKGRNWSLFEAEKFGESLRVSERVTDRRGREWPRVNSWYWSAAFGWSSGPWWTVTIVEPIGNGR